ncbi:MAG: Nif3-like dinuclear metal center hexameric protein [Prevotellaceae bacterium]|nr:Nif3-like dinuclear metal center hexameric protein [Candidatus Minthosoma equi]
MKIKEILGALEEFAPLALQDGYDNAGLQIGLAKDADATGALLCLDVTEDVVDEAVRMGCNLIVSHHPLLFRPVKSITGNDYIGRTIMKAIQEGVAIYSAHTNLDSAYEGVNYKIAEKLGLQNLAWLSSKGNYVRNGEQVSAGEGVIGDLPEPMSAEDFMQVVKNTFGVDSLRVNVADKKVVSRVALCGGAGAFLISQAVSSGADAFLTGEIGYHRFFGYEHNILLLELGHFESERYTMEILHDIIARKAPALPVHFTKIETNPIKNI